MSQHLEKRTYLSCRKEVELARLQTRIDSLERRFEQLHESLLRLFKKLDELIPAVARLEVKAGVWGGVGGILAALAIIAVAFATRL